MRNNVVAAWLLLCFITGGQYVIAQTSKKNEYNTPNLYAGIDVGSKGVKLSVIELKKNGQLGNSFFAVKDTSVNTDFISFTQQTFDATLNGLAGLFQTAVTTFNIPFLVYP